MIEIDRLDAIAAQLFVRHKQSPASAGTLMREVFREVGLRPKQQKRVRDLLHGMLSSSVLIDHAIEVAAPGAIVDTLLPSVRILTSRVLAHDLSPKAASAKLPWIDWKRVADLRDEVRELPDPIRRIELLASIPRWLAERLDASMGESAEACATALTGRPPVTLRANTLRGPREELAERLAAEAIETRPTRFAAHGLEVVSPAQLLRTRAFRGGWFELQDEASQLVAELVVPPTDGLVVDACAGAGGKTLALAAAMQNTGEILALDTSRARLDDLRRRARSAGVKNVRVKAVAAGGWSSDVTDWIARADRVLVDAPCSGIGSLRRNPDMRRRLEEAEIRRLHRVQVDLLGRVAGFLKAGALAIYATCTVLPEENEDVVRSVCDRGAQLERVPLAEVLGERAAAIADPTGLALQALPHVHGTDGFYAAVLRPRV